MINRDHTYLFFSWFEVKIIFEKSLLLKLLDLSLGKSVRKTEIFTSLRFLLILSIRCYSIFIVIVGTRSVRRHSRNCAIFKNILAFSSFRTQWFIVNELNNSTLSPVRCQTRVSVFFSNRSFGFFSFNEYYEIWAVWFFPKLKLIKT